MPTTPDDVRRLALALPEVQDDSQPPRLAFSVRGRGLAWSWLERIAARKPRVIRPEVVAVRCVLEAKAELMASAPDRYFEDDHYRGYPAVLVCLAAISEDELATRLEDAWRVLAKAPVRKPRKGQGAAGIPARRDG